uniref:Actin-related protein 2 n=1 Tax=Pseudo-nitzschia australis TaxID=44445 RepID=A0A7S4AXR3_9STRA|mmetsp:Transcript_25708/g.56376  ORF Transcript_25708/g.56376 Transcript_25708/m.56376 type:complete len:414 (+) Transcript_25708:273-1514(+)
MTSATPHESTRTTSRTTLVCDMGSSLIKVGIAGNLTPVKIIPCLLGSPRYSSKYQGDSEREILVGDDALKGGKHQKIGYRYPMKATGHVQDWNSLEVLLKAAFRDVLCKLDCDYEYDTAQYKVLVAKPYDMKRADLKTLVDILLVGLGFGAVAMHEQAALVLYTQGVETGVVVELGESIANIVPVYKGHAIPKLDRSLAFGGRSITSHLIKLLRLKGFQLNEKEDLEIGRQIKEAACYVALDPDSDERLAAETTVLTETFKLPDGTMISVGRERFGAVEALFKPNLYNSNESGGLSDMIFEVIQDADIDCRADLYRNVILSGGTSLIPGMQERLEQDLNRRYTNDVLDGRQSRLSSNSLGWKPKVQAPASRQNLVFEGAALFADYVSNDENYWVGKEDYARAGIQQVLDKCRI